MLAHRTPEYLEGLVHRLRGFDRETEWVEFKVDNTNPDTIGRSISALSNGAALNDAAAAYMVWGIEDSTHDIVGTSFSPFTTKQGNESLEAWLTNLLNPRADFRFHDTTVDRMRVVILEIEPASRQPVAFGRDRFIRVGESTRHLRDVPGRERALWSVFERNNFADGAAAERLSDADVLQALDYPAYFTLQGMPLPDGSAPTLRALEMENLIARSDAGGWDIANLGAILFAKNLNDFRWLRRKAPRIIQYRGTGRFEALKEEVNTRGYTVGFEEVVGHIMALTPAEEVIEHVTRREITMFPELAVRELVANMLIHQDFSVAGAGPMVEIFDNRIEMSNPGEPLVDTQRFLDTPPKSRNEPLAAIMRRFGFSEERGTGIDKVIAEAETFHLPAPLFEAPGEFTRCTLYAQRALSDMDSTERARACYQHACLRYVLGLPMNNASVRNRFGLAKTSSAVASRILRYTLNSGLIAIRHPEAGTRNRTYIPAWAV